MKRNLPWATVLAPLCGLAGMTGWAGSAAQPEPLPTPFPEARYGPMSAKSPFAVATAAVVPSAAPTPGFAAQLYVDGVAHLDNTDYVAIKNRAPAEGKPAVVLVEVGKCTNDGLRVDRVHWSDELGKSTVDVSKGGEKATLVFDEDQMAKSAPNTSNAPNAPYAAPPPQMVRALPGASLGPMPRSGWMRSHMFSPPNRQ